MEDQPEPHGGLLGLPNFNALCISKHIHPCYYYIDLYSYLINSKIIYSPRNCFNIFLYELLSVNVCVPILYTQSCAQMFKVKRDCGWMTWMTAALKVSVFSNLALYILNTSCLPDEPFLLSWEVPIF